MERQQRNTVSKHKDTRILMSSPYSPILHLRSSFQWWPCFIVFKQRITMQGLNVSSPEVGLLGRLVLGFPKPLEYTDSSSSYQLCDLLVYSGRSQVGCSIRTDSSMGWLESLKLCGAWCCHWSARPSASFCFCFTTFFSSFCLSVFSLPPRGSLWLTPTMYSVSVHGF